MNLLEYMRRRNKMTLSEWEDTFEKKEREIRLAGARRGDSYQFYPIRERS